MVAPQSRTLVRYRDMIARRAPPPAHRVRVNRGEQGRTGDGGAFMMTLRTLRRTRANTHPLPFTFLLPLEYLMALAEGGASALPPARILVA